MEHTTHYADSLVTGGTMCERHVLWFADIRFTCLRIKTAESLQSECKDIEED